MRGKEDLYKLIQAMSRSEKRYFTLDAQKSGKKGKKYLDLFQAVNAMDNYDETKLKKKFPKNLSSDKAYLYEAILRSMRDYRSSKSRAAQIKEKLLDFKYLYELGLYDQCEERLKEAKDLAIELGNELAMLEINREERRLVKDTSKKNKKAKERILELIEEKNKNLKAIYYEFKYLDLHDQLILEAIHHFSLKTDNQKEQFKKSFYLKLFNHENEPTLSIHSTLRYYQSKALYAQLMGDFSGVFENYTKVLEWWDTNPKIKEEEFYRYILDASNLLHACYSNKKLGVFLALLEKMESEQPSNSHDQVVLFRKTAIYRLVYYINSGDFKDLDTFVDRIEAGLSKYDLKIANRMTLIFNTALVFFIQEDYQQCALWLNKILKKIKTNIRHDIQTASHLINIITSFELDKFEEFDSLFRAAYRFFNEKTTIKTKDFEFEVLVFLKKLANAPLMEIKGIYKDFDIYIKENPSKSSLGLDELLLCWVNSKIKKTSVIQNIKELTTTS